MEPRTRIATIFTAGLAAIMLGVVVLYGMNGRAVHAGVPALLDQVKLSANRPPIPDVRFADAAGKPVALADFKGRAVVLNLWATWCAPCIAELPELAQAKARLPDDKVTVVAVDLERLGTEKVGDFLKEHDASGLAIYTDGELALMRAFKTESLPLTVLIDSDGHVAATASGPQKWGNPASVAYLKTLAIAR